MEKFRKPLLLLCKLLFTAAAVWLLSRQLDLPKLHALFQALSLPWLVAAFLALNIAQLASALRMRYYFVEAGLKLSHGYSIALYYIGMLFNHLLPGGIGGDGYKAYAVKSRFGFPLSSAIRLMICGRANGLLFLVLVGLGFALFSAQLSNLLPFFPLLVFAAALFTTLSYSLLAKHLLKEPVRQQIGAGFYSIWVQGMVAVCAAFLFQALAGSYSWMGGGHAADYLLLFMVSCFVSVLPISFGGLGLRELTFFMGAGLLGLNAEAGVAVALLYFLCNLSASLIGAVYFLVGTKQEEKEQKT